MSVSLTALYKSNLAYQSISQGCIYLKFVNVEFPYVEYKRSASDQEKNSCSQITIFWFVFLRLNYGKREKSFQKV
jgi:hypothetical protein